MSGLPFFLGYLIILGDYKDHEVLRETSKGHQTSISKLPCLLRTKSLSWTSTALPGHRARSCPHQASSFLFAPNSLFTPCPLRLSTSYETHKARRAARHRLSRCIQAVVLKENPNVHYRRHAAQLTFCKCFQRSSRCPWLSDISIHNIARRLSAHSYGVECRNPTLLFHHAGTIRVPVIPRGMRSQHKILRKNTRQLGLAWPRTPTMTNLRRDSSPCDTGSVCFSHFQEYDMHTVCCA